MPDLICLKCDSKWDSQYLERKGVHACPLCKEPMPEAMELDKATWAEGDLGKEG